MYIHLNRRDEEEEIRRLRVVKILVELDENKHAAVRKIASTFKRLKQRITGKRNRHIAFLGKATDATDRSNLLWSRVQRCFREYSTRQWFAERRVNFCLKKTGSRGEHKKPKLPGEPEDVSKADLEKRVGYEVCIYMYISIYV
jgi:hypothetical protein